MVKGKKQKDDNKDQEQEFYEEELKRHNDMGKFAREHGMTMGECPEANEPPALNSDGSLKEKE